MQRTFSPASSRHAGPVFDWLGQDRGVDVRAAVEPGLRLVDEVRRLALAEEAERAERREHEQREQEDRELVAIRLGPGAQGEPEPAAVRLERRRARDLAHLTLPSRLRRERLEVVLFFDVVVLVLVVLVGEERAARSPTRRPPGAPRAGA